MAESILAAALMFWFSRRMGFFSASLFFFMLGGGSFLLLRMLFSGFRNLRIAKTVADTPRMTIGSIALGLVNIRGKAESDETIPSPVSHTPCCFYKVHVELAVTREDQAGRTTIVGWTLLKSDKHGTRFFLVDNTGKAVIDLGSDRDCEREPRGFSLVKDPDQAEIRLDSDDGYGYALEQYSTRIVDPDHPHASVGGVADEEIWPYIRQLLRPAKAVDSCFRLREFLVLPGGEYQVVGTSVENTDAQGLEDRNLICKGERMPILISATKDIPTKDLIVGATATIAVAAVFSAITLGFLLFFIAWLLNDQVPLSGDAAAIAGSVWVGGAGGAFLLLTLALWVLAKPKST